jgi:hypothetical protein
MAAAAAVVDRDAVFDDVWAAAIKELPQTLEAEMMQVPCSTAAAAAAEACAHKPDSPSLCNIDLLSAGRVSSSGSSSGVATAELNTVGSPEVLTAAATPSSRPASREQAAAAAAAATAGAAVKQRDEFSLEILLEQWIEQELAATGAEAAAAAAEAQLTTAATAGTGEALQMARVPACRAGAVALQLVPADDAAAVNYSSFAAPSIGQALWDQQHQQVAAAAVEANDAAATAAAEALVDQLVDELMEAAAPAIHNSMNAMTAGRSVGNNSTAAAVSSVPASLNFAASMLPAGYCAHSNSTAAAAAVESASGGVAAAACFQGTSSVNGTSAMAGMFQHTEAAAAQTQAELQQRLAELCAEFHAVSQELRNLQQQQQLLAYEQAAQAAAAAQAISGADSALTLLQLRQ